MIKINDQTYDAKVIVAGDGSMSVSFKGTTETISSIEALFASALKIEIIEEGETVGVYYNKEINSLSAKKIGSLYDITIFLRVAKVSVPEETVLQTQIDNVKDAIAQIKESNSVTDNAVDELGVFSADNKSDIEILSDAVNELGSFSADNKSAIDVLSDAIDDLANVVAELMTPTTDSGSGTDASSETTVTTPTDTTTEETNTTTEKGENING